ncbi:MAG: NAD(P)/FAD-dependent oxidoreductase [Gemmatimonadales bacterium]
MPDYRYLIIGGGMTADAAARGIRERDISGSIGIIGGESDPPYSRPPLTKGLWKGDAFDSVWRKTREVNVDLHVGRTVTKIDPDARRVTDDQGTAHGYEKLLLATGATPRRLAGDEGGGGDDVIYFRTLADYRRLHAVVDGKPSAVVIGGGFIGSEIAAALAMNGCKVTMLFPEAGIGARVFPADLAGHLVGYYREHNVTVRPGEEVAVIETGGNGRIVVTKSGSRFPAEVIVAGLGVTPNVELARSIGITIDNGIVVDQHLGTSRPGIWAAGDVASFDSPQLGKRMRVEHEDNALIMGGAAGRAMAGDTTPYTHLPFFYSDLFDLGYEAVGDTDPRLETFADWTTPFQSGVVYYLAKQRVRGVVLWGIFGKVDAARALIADPAPVTAQSLRGRIVAEE